MMISPGSTCRRSESVIDSELKRGISETSRYLLSHHTDSEIYRCYALRLGKRTVHLCSRCVGVYAGILLGALLHALRLLPRSAYLPAVAVLPLFALLDWSASAFTGWKGHNPLRTLTGLLLGMAYALGITLFLTSFPNLAVAWLGLFYGAVAEVLLSLKKAKGSPATRES